VTTAVPERLAAALADRYRIEREHYRRESWQHDHI